MNPDASNTVFQKAVAFVNQTNKHLFLTGKAGTGKTTFLKYIKENTFKRMAVLAPTGVAAINAGGVTIHSFFQLPLGTFLPTDKTPATTPAFELNTRTTLLNNLRLQRSKRELLKELDLLIIDEVSMVRADLLDAVDVVMRYVKKQPLQPFGGIQMLYIGDLFQLPPVVKNEEWDILREFYASPFFFDAHALQQAQPLYLELKKIYRQQDDVFIRTLNNIRNNCCSQADLDLLHQHYQPDFFPPKEEHYITLCSHNYLANQINQRELEKLPGKVYNYAAEISGEFGESAYPAEKQLQLKQGSQIMFIRNDKGEERKYYNGKIGIVKRIERAKIVVKFPDNNEELELEQEEWQNVRYRYDSEKERLEEEKLGTFKQYPIRLAWAITIHKSQGLTFEKAIIDAGASFAPGQVYVSLSRLTNLKGLVLRSKILPHCISTDSRVLRFVKNEMNEEAIEQTLEEEQKIFVAQWLTAAFSFEKIENALQVHLEDYEERKIPDKEKCQAWAAKLTGSATELNEVAQKFQKQLAFLFLSAAGDGYKKVSSRVASAVTYFTTELEVVVRSTEEQIKAVRHKQKIKRYVKELHELVVLFNGKKQQLHQAMKMSEALEGSQQMQKVLELVESSRKAAPAGSQEDGQTAPVKPEKGESSRISLEMFKNGKSVDEISTEREMARSTIEGHLAGFITTGEVDILELVDPATLKMLSELMESDGELSHSIIKQKAGDQVSYGAIKAVSKYRERVKKVLASN
jgi:hypothetical protein